MRLKTAFLALMLGFGSVLSGQADSTKIHQVEKGETKYGISRQYQISIETLERYNPEIKAGLKQGMSLLIPLVREEESTKGPPNLAGQDTNGTSHKVKAGETLYSLSRTYGVSLEALQAENPFLKEGLKVGQVLRIPKPVEKEMPGREWAYKYHLHKVEPQETPWSISQQYDISLDSLYLLNPEAQNGLRIGQVVKLPKNRQPGDERVVAKAELANDTMPWVTEKPLTPADTIGGYFLYQVKSGDSFYALKQRFAVDKEELEKLNPEVAEGLQVGKYIIIPRKRTKENVAFFDRLFSKVEKTGPEGDPDHRQLQARDSLNLGRPADTGRALIEDTLEVDLQKTYRVAVLLPFYAPRDSAQWSGSAEDLEIEKRATYGVELFNGLRLAADSLAREGMHLQLKVMDTRNNRKRIETMLPEIRRGAYDLVIGPLYHQNAEFVASELKREGIPVISPLSSRLNVEGLPNLIKCVPGETSTAAFIARLINERHRASQVVFVDYVPEGGKGQHTLLREVNARLQPRTTVPPIKTFGITEEEMDFEELHESLADSLPVVVVTLSEDRVFLTALVRELRSLNREEIAFELVAPTAIMEVPTLDLRYLNDLKLTMAEPNYIDYRDSAVVRFVSQYRQRFEAEPTRYAFQGYDVGMYFLRKLWRTGPYFMQGLQDRQRLLGIGFQLESAPDGGFENRYLHLTGIRNFELVRLPSITHPDLRP